MSHISKFELEGEGPVTVIHNGDWDGTATVVWEDGDGEHRSEVPGRLLVRLGEQAALAHLRGKTVGFLESLEGPPPLRTVNVDPAGV